MKCPSCASTVQEDAVFCDQCGARLGTAVEAPVGPVPAAPESPAIAVAAAAPGSANACPACGTVNMPGELFCTDCGTPLQAPMPEPELAMVPPPVMIGQPMPVAQEPAAPAPVVPAETVVAPVEPVVVTPAALVCASCGVRVEAGDLFCHACGTRVAPAMVQGPAAAASTTVVAPTAEIAPLLMPAPASVCPACGAHLTPGEAFCEFCGAALVAPVQRPAVAPVASTVGTAPSAAAAVTATIPSPAGAAGGPVLVVVETGQKLPLAQGTEVLVGREDPYSNTFPDVDLTPFGAEEKGVSRRHFKLTLAEGQYAVLDLGSTYTWLNQQRLEPNVPARLNDGDEIRAGRLKLVFRTRP
jgi:hypothetical protein